MGPYPGVITTKSRSFTIGDVIPGAIYSYQVVAVSDEDNSNRSGAAATKLQVPEPEGDVPELPEDEADQGSQPDNEGNNEENNGNNGNNQDGNNGNGNMTVTKKTLIKAINLMMVRMRTLVILLRHQM